MFNVTRYIIASVAVAVVYEALNFVVHSLLLSSTYQTMTEVWRPEMMGLMWVMNIVSLCFGFLLVFLFSRKEKHDIGTGIKLGLIAGLFFLVFPSINQFVVYPITFSLALQWAIYGLIQVMICGVVAALIYKPKTAA